MMLGAKLDTKGSSGVKRYWISTATCFIDGEIARCCDESQLLFGGSAVATAGQMYA